MFERFEQMDKRTLVRLAIAAVLGILLFSTIVGGIHQAGWNQGFTAGLLAGGGENAKAVAPYLAAPGVYRPHGWGGHGSGFIGGFLHFLFFGFLIMMALKFFVFRRWRMHNGWHGEQGGRCGWQGGPWQHGPWGHHHGQPQDKPEGESRSEPGSGPCASPAQPTEHKPQNTSWINV